MMGDESLMRMIIGAAYKAIPKQLEELEDSIDFGDILSAGNIAHTIKGTTANIGADEMSEITRKIEMAAHAKDLPTLEMEMTALNEAFKRLVAALREWLPDSDNDA